MKDTCIKSSQKNIELNQSDATPQHLSRYFPPFRAWVKLCKVNFRTYKHHQNMLVTKGILIFVPHMALWRPSGGLSPGGQRHHQHGGVYHDHQGGAYMAFVTYILWTFNQVQDLSLEDGKYLNYLLFFRKFYPTTTTLWG